MKNICKAIILSAIIAIASPSASFAKDYVLQYQKANRWVATEDAATLRSFLRKAKKLKIQKFEVILPRSKRHVALERLIVLRDMLEQQTKNGVILEEVAGKTNRNTITIRFKAK